VTQGANVSGLVELRISVALALRVSISLFPRCTRLFSTGATIEEVRRQMQEALEFHFEGLAEDGLPIPEPASSVSYVEVSVPVA